MARIGHFWSSKEEEQLLDEIKTKQISEIAIGHKRTYGSIKSRLKQIAYKLYKYKHKPVEEIIEITKLSMNEINYTINQYERQNDNLPHIHLKVQEKTDEQKNIDDNLIFLDDEKVNNENTNVIKKIMTNDDLIFIDKSDSDNNILESIKNNSITTIALKTGKTQDEILNSLYLILCEMHNIKHESVNENKIIIKGTEKNKMNISVVTIILLVWTFMLVVIWYKFGKRINLMQY